ncbi:unnamed protein product [Rotaria sp. Silwood2]|nr:unnamed protein product [Rotaria sp. Silwood2]CAF3087592.1 unnamed protein product [Rotaria sp. Silwood2]CAF3417779.1 unnamed protein product [Rotaria sp. Silwood2]CAF4482318.1 unnamed protein product [Rotaria sp. Silwood2]CAF4493148.1 unnamed protein product [Rotaria sp. Silwood2]
MELLIKLDNGVKSGKNSTTLFIKVLPETQNMQMVAEFVEHYLAKVQIPWVQYSESCKKLILSSAAAKLSEEANAILKSKSYSNCIEERLVASTSLKRPIESNNSTSIKKKQKKTTKIRPMNTQTTILQYFSKITKKIVAPPAPCSKETNVLSRYDDDCSIISCLPLHAQSNTNDKTSSAPPTNSLSSSSSHIQASTISSSCSSSSTELTSKYFRNRFMPRPIPRIARVSNSTPLQRLQQQQISHENAQNNSS